MTKTTFSSYFTFNETNQKKAVIIDHLSLDYPNPEFIEKTTELLAEHQYRTDYIAGDLTTVDFYRSLPLQKYDLLIFRVHSSANVRNDYSQMFPKDYLFLFTGEPLNNLYQQERNDLRLAGFYWGSSEQKVYYTLTPKFIQHSMQGKFYNSTLIFMGCDGLNPDSISLAEAFLDKGITTVIGWNKSVSVEHTDQATFYLLHTWLNQKTDIEEAVRQTNQNLGTDPFYQARLSILSQ